MPHFFFHDMMQAIGRVYSMKSKPVFVYPGSTLLTGSNSLQLWSNVNGVKDEGEEQGKQAEMTIRDSHSPWRCIWQSK